MRIIGSFALMDGIEHTIQHFSPHRTHTLLYIYTRRVLLLLPLYIYLRVYKGSLRGLMNKLILICCINKVFSPHTHIHKCWIFCVYIYLKHAHPLAGALMMVKKVLLLTLCHAFIGMRSAYTQYLYNHFVIVVYSSRAYTHHHNEYFPYFSIIFIYKETSREHILYFSEINLINFYYTKHNFMRPFVQVLF